MNGLLPKKLTLNLTILLLFLWGINDINAQRVLESSAFPEPITSQSIVYASMIFIDENENGNHDAAFVLSQDEIQSWSDYSAAIAFYNNIQVRHGGVFSGENNITNIPVVSGSLYHFWIEIDPVSKTYTTWAQTGNMPEPVLIFENADFRNQDATAIERWSTINNPQGEPDIVEVKTIKLVDAVGKLPPMAIYFPGGNDGNHSNVAIPPLNIENLPVTIEMWYMPDPMQPFYSTLWYTRESENNNSGVQYDRWGDTEKIKGVWNGSSGTGLHPNYPLKGEWNHVALVITENTKTLYLNGVPFEQTGSFTNFNFNGTTYLGWDPAVNDRTLRGLVNEFRIWNTARSAQELSDYKNETLTGCEDGIIGYWNFNNASPQVTDLTNNEKHGIINGAVYVDLTDASLKSISLSTGSINENFSSSIFNYTAELPSGTTSVNISAETSVIYGANIHYPNSGIIDVSSGSAEIELIVTAADGITTSSYNIQLVVIDESKDATLAQITPEIGALDPIFDPEVSQYNLIVPKGTTSINIDAETNIQEASLAGDGNISLTNGMTTVHIEVTATDGETSRTYTINVSEADGTNYALQLSGDNGNNSHINISGFPLNNLPYTIEMWIKPEATQADNTGLFYHRGISQSGIQYASGWQGSGKLRLMTNVASNDYGTLTDIEVVPGEWQHVAAVVTSTSSTIYLNGNEYSRQVNNQNYDYSTGNLYIGWDSDANNRAFNGTIDEVRVWNAARTTQQIEENKFTIYNVGSEEQLLGYWNFDLLNNSQAVNLGSSKYHGTIKGGTYVVSSVFTPMEYQSSNSQPLVGYINANSKNNAVLKLEIQTRYQKNPLRLTELVLNPAGTSNKNNITNIRVYSTGKSELFDTAQLIAELKDESITDEFEIQLDHTLIAGNNHIWITYDISSEALNGDEFTLYCESFILDGVEPQRYVPEKLSPDNKLTVNTELFINHSKFQYDVVTQVAATSVEGANFASFQQNAIMTYNGYQYVTYWNRAARVCLARKQLPDGEWEVIEFTDHTVSLSRVADNHYTISMGICENDGTIHLSYDHHNTELRYKRSVPGLANNPDEHLWNEASFGPRINYLISGNPVGNVTYPRFLSKPNGDLLFECRIGWSGSGDSFLWEYSGESGTWTYIGEYLHGTTSDENAYINGINYDPNGRLHVSWIWRRTPDPRTNHDVYYAYSDDDGRTWYNAQGTQIGTVNTNPVTLTSPGTKIWDIGTNRGLINQESQAVDSKGRIHILQSYMPDHLPNNNDFWGARINHGFLRHIFIDDDGNWHNTLIAPSGRNRSEIAVDENDNVYVVGGNYRIYFAAASENYQTWTELDVSESNTGMNEGLIDRTALLNENVLSFVFAHSDNDGKIIVPYYQLEQKHPGNGNGLNLSLFEDEEVTIPVSQFLDKVNIEGGVIDGVGSGLLRVSGVLETRYAEPYSLYLTTSDNTKVWINDKLILETGTVASATEFRIEMPHVPFHKNRIRIESEYNAETTRLKLEWESQSQTREIIQTSSLYGKLIDYTTTLETIKEDINFQYFPNPFNNGITILKSGNFMYQVYSINGVMVESGYASNHIEIGHQLISGVYILTIKQDSSSKTVKVVKM
ncbi:BNR-4 repeat-containing protein [Natronoflexus pectinivorans]|uniref:Putative secreted protein (Por secretion system target) n=1 Tax=Natronoflexus pectinivorans TaxID=682526 RepID=A0A4R2GLI9_9BACT|nr:BNR-4 repeat-containing protein [Natronoflexus pectinivorans]TCO09862.1 putative secreted protein (Por secretion system target) [Natronoflexus pectinivorans]